MRPIFIFLLMLSVSIAAETTLPVFEQRDFGPAYYEQFDDVRVTMDCDADIITIYITDNDQPVTGAVVRLLYVDYSVPLLGAGPTDNEGRFKYTIVGDKNLMTGLFLVVIEKEGYKNKEAHFDLRKCTYERVEEPPPPEEQPPAEEQPPEEEETPPPVAEPPIVPEINITEITDIAENITLEPTEVLEPEYPCALSAMLLLSLIVLRIKQ